MRTTATPAATAEKLLRVGVPSAGFDPTLSPFFGEGGPAVQPGIHVPLTSATPRRSENVDPGGAGGVPRQSGQFS